MDSFLSKDEGKKGINKVFAAGVIGALVVIAGAIYLMSFRPSIEEQTDQILAGAYREGSPEYERENKEIVISTDDKTVESPTGMGTISMYINGKIRNKGTKTVDVLEVNVAIVTQFNDVLKQRRILVVPVQQQQLGPGEIIPITLTMDGFTREDDRANIRWKVTAIRTR